MTNLKKLITLFFLACALMSCGTASQTSDRDTGEVEDSVVVHSGDIRYGVDVYGLNCTENSIKSGDIITTILKRHGATDADIRQILLLPDSIFSPKSLKAGNNYSAYNECDSAARLRYWVYSHNVQHFTVFHFDSAVTVTEYYKPVSVTKRVSEFEIESSLWQAIDNQGLNINLALDLSDIFAWTVDFFGLQENDVFRVYYSEQYVDSVSIGIDTIYAASFTRDTTTCYAIYYANDEVDGYWELNGDNVQKAFLKAPLKFSRISSGFSYARRHPVHKTVRPHTGVDYAAPSGMPVMTIGDGVVVERGYKGGGGNTVKIRHNSTYTSAYLHLSRFAKNISVGTQVKQGQVIGYVGSTGTSTGPHLDFRIWRQGKPINPLKLESPPTEPISQQYMAEFDSVKQIMVTKLNE